MYSNYYNISKFSDLENEINLEDQNLNNGTNFNVITNIDIYSKIEYLADDYPGFKHWFFNKVIPGLKKKEREILLCMMEVDAKQELGGIAILKNTEEEKKICTLMVCPQYQNNGVGFKLFEKSFEILNTNRPIFTVSEDRLRLFKKHIEKFGFKNSYKYVNYYSMGKAEYVFNGILL